jgi:acyl-coenzyme A synthetase/AMP-(fatty) acid ligase
MPAMLLAMPATKHDDFSAQVRFGFGAGVDPRHHTSFEQRFGFPLIEAWSMTETGAGACIAAAHEPRHVGERCFGRAGAALQYRLVDESDNDVPPGQPGELLVRSTEGDGRRGFFSGYVRDPVATEQAWRDGWFHTGDVVRVDAQGSFFFVDRRRNIVRRSGENIAALEVENALAAIAGVRLAAVAPVPDELRGEEVMACIVLTDGIAANRDIAEAIFDAARSRLAYFKAPGYIAFVDELPRTSSEKPQRGRLKQLCAELLARGAVHDFRERKKRPDES